MLFLSMLIAGMLDLKYRKIPDYAIFLICISGIFFYNIGTFERIVGGIFPALPLFFVALKYPQLKGGDIKYIAGLGFGVGINALAEILFFSAVFSVFYSLIKRKTSVPLAFVCFIGFVFGRCLI